MTTIFNLMRLGREHFPVHVHPWWLELFVFCRRTGDHTRRALRYGYVLFIRALERDLRDRLVLGARIVRGDVHLYARKKSYNSLVITHGGQREHVPKLLSALCVIQ